MIRSEGGVGSNGDPVNRCTPEEYLARERNAELKSEYIDGRIIAMTPGG